MKGKAAENITRRTRQRSLLVNCLRQSGGHVTADDIIEKLKKNSTPVAKSTVYRHLSQLEDEGSVRKYILSEGQPACYQYIGNGVSCVKHYHLMCQRCESVVHFEDAELAPALKSAGESGGFTIDGFRTVFYGFCRECSVQEVK